MVGFKKDLTVFRHDLVLASTPLRLGVDLISACPDLGLDDGDLDCNPISNYIQHIIRAL